MWVCSGLHNHSSHVNCLPHTGLPCNSFLHYTLTDRSCLHPTISAVRLFVASYLHLLLYINTTTSSTRTPHLNTTHTFFLPPTYPVPLPITPRSTTHVPTADPSLPHHWKRGIPQILSCAFNIQRYRYPVPRGHLIRQSDVIFIAQPTPPAPPLPN